MRNVYRNLGNETTCDVFATRYCIATESMRSSCFSFVECVIKAMTYHRVLREAFSRVLSHWLQCGTHLQKLFVEHVSNPDFITPIAGIVEKLITRAGSENSTWSHGRLGWLRQYSCFLHQFLYTPFRQKALWKLLALQTLRSQRSEIPGYPETVL